MKDKKDKEWAIIFPFRNVSNDDSSYKVFNPLAISKYPIKFGNKLIGPILILKRVTNVPQNIFLYPWYIRFPPLPLDNFEFP